MCYLMHTTLITFVNQKRCLSVNSSDQNDESRVDWKQGETGRGGGGGGGWRGEDCAVSEPVLFLLRNP